MPWVKLYYRSCWKNTQNISQVQVDGLSASSQDMKNGQFDANGIAVAPAALFGTQIAREVDTTFTASHKVTGAQQNCANAENTMHHDQLQWLSMSTANRGRDASSAMLSEQDGLTVHKSTNNLSTAYSRRLLISLAQALKKSGVDPSQANISVQINMGRRAKRPNANTAPSSSKFHEGEESIQATKRPRGDHT